MSQSEIKEAKQKALEKARMTFGGYNVIFKKNSTHSLKQSSNVFNNGPTVLPPHWNSSGGELGSMDITDASKSGMTVLTNISSVKFGDTIHVRIDAKDVDGRQRVLGGDFWSALFTNRQSNYACSVPGKFVDYANGTYSVHFNAVCSGKTAIEISLIHPKEAVQFLRTQYSSMEDKAAWKGSFGKGIHMTDERRCVLHRDGTWKNKCEYRYKTGLGRSVLLCDRPRVRMLACSDLKYLTCDFPAPSVTKLLKNYRYIFRPPGKLTGKPVDLNINPEKDNQKTLVHCYQLMKSGLKSTFTGYWFNGTWVSSDCTVRTFDRNKTRHCLKDKSIHMFGDSTTRQLFDELSSVLVLEGNRMNWDPQYDNNIKLDRNYYKKIRGVANFEPNIKIDFYFNPFMVTKSKVRIKDYVFEDEILNNMNECNYIVIVSPWAHYTTWTPESFLERLAYIKNSLKELKNRCPDTTIVVKGSHPREKQSWQANAYNSDWIMYNVNKQLEATFDEDWILFLNVWDLNRSYLGGISLHMPQEVIRQELALFLSYICPYY
ncbi:NXPE family member 3-like [Glandiceps talaboti]